MSIEIDRACSSRRGTWDTLASVAKKQILTNTLSGNSHGHVLHKAAILPARYCFSYTRTQSTSIVVGSFVVASGSFGQSPPTARLKITKNG